MNMKEIFLRVNVFLLIIFILALSMSCVSADNNTASFSDLKNLIDDAGSGDVITLTDDYIGDNSTGDIKVNKPISIDGNGHYLDAFNYSRVFNFINASDVKFYNLTFKNGFANEVGGAVYSYNSSLSFIDCTFLDNQAPSGGAVYSKYSEVSFTGCRFLNNSAIEAGAVFLDCSVGEYKDSIFINNSAVRTSGAIFTQYSVNSVDGCEFINNSVKGDTPFAGAVAFYQYENNISNSKFINNSISGEYGYGSSIFNYGILNIKNTEIRDNKQNTRNKIENTIYNALGKINLENTTIENNTQTGFEDLIYTLFWPMVFDSVLDENVTIPSSYDSRNVTLENGTTVSYVSPVKNQLNSGSCWAFASVSALETYLLIHENKLYDFSENNEKNIMGSYAEHGWILNPNSGGGTPKVIAYWSRWSGPVNESDDPYNDTSIISPDDLPVVKHVQDVVYLPVMNNDELKRAIMEYGSVVIGYKYHDPEIFFANGTYYASEVSPFNAIPIYSSHLVTLVGWDDNYPGSKFGENIPDGAFILKNSFGTTGYDKKLNVTYVEQSGGFNYISYYDLTLSKENIPYAVVNLENTDNYEKNYFYDYKGSLVNLGFNNETAWFSNQFKSTGNSPLEAFSLYTFAADSVYETFIYVNDELAYTQNGTIHNPGYNTIKLNELVDLRENDVFKVVVKLTTPGLLYPVSIECDVADWIGNMSTEFNESFISPDGVNWYDLHSNVTVLYKDFGSKIVYYNLSNAHVCLKAFTSKISDTLITADNLTFKALENHCAVINLADIKHNPLSNQNIIVNILKSDAFLLNTYNLTTDDKGNVYIDVSKLLPGNYDVLFSFKGNGKYVGSDNSSQIRVIPLNTFIEAFISKLDDNYYLVEGRVFDENANPVLSGSISYTINGKSNIYNLNDSYFSFIIDSDNVFIEFLNSTYYLSSNINLTYSDNSNTSDNNLYEKTHFSKNTSGNPILALILGIFALPVLFMRIKIF